MKIPYFTCSFKTELKSSFIVTSCTFIIELKMINFFVTFILLYFTACGSYRQVEKRNGKNILAYILPLTKERMINNKLVI